MNIHLTLDGTTQSTLDRLVSAIENLAETAQRTEERRTQESQRFAAAYHNDRDFHHEEYINLSALPALFTPSEDPVGLENPPFVSDYQQNNGREEELS